MLSIVYSSNTGYTEQYARILAEKTGLPLYDLAEAEKTLEKDSEIIYLSWLMAGQITNYKKAQKFFKIKAVCAVGLCVTGTMTEETRSGNKIPQSVSLFTLQGGYAPEKLKGMYKFMMKLVTRVLIKKIDKMQSPEESDLHMKRVLQKGGSYVSEENLKDVLEFLK